MKINPSNGLINQPISDRKPTHIGIGPSATKTEGVDRTTLSTSTPTVSRLVSQAMQTPSVRQDKVNALRTAIESNNYSVNNMVIAGAIASESGS